MDMTMEKNQIGYVSRFHVIFFSYSFSFHTLLHHLSMDDLGNGGRQSWKDDCELATAKISEARSTVPLKTTNPEGDEDYSFKGELTLKFHDSYNRPKHGSS